MPNAAATVLPWKRLPSVSEQMSRSRISRSPAAKADSSIGPARTATARPSLVRVTVSGHGPGMPGSCWSSMTARLSFQGHNRLIFRHQDHDGFPSSRAFRARLRRPPADRSGGAGEDRADPDCAGAGLPRSRHRLPAANPQVRPRAQSTTTGGLGLRDPRMSSWAALARCVVALQSRLLSSRQGCDWGSEVSRVSPWPTMRSVIRPPGADYLVGWRETTVSKKWSGDYDGGAGNSNSDG